MRPSATTPIFRRDIQYGDPRRISDPGVGFTPYSIPLGTIPPNVGGFVTLERPTLVHPYGAYHVIATTGGNPTPNSQVAVVDFFTDITKPVIIGLLDTNPAPAHSGLGMFPRDILIGGTTLYLANEVWGAFWTVDLTDPTNPQNLIIDNLSGTAGGTLPFLGQGQPFRIKFHPNSSTHIVQAERLNSRVRIIDLTTGNTAATVSTGAPSTGPVELEVWSGFAATKVTGLNEFWTIDIDPIGSSSHIGTIVGETIGAQGQFDDTGEMFYESGLIYMITRDGGAAWFTVVDVTNPAAPFIVGERYDEDGPPPLSTAFGSSAGSLIKIGDLCYVGDGNQRGYVYDVSDPSNPDLISAVFVQPITTGILEGVSYMVWEPSIDSFIHMDTSFDRTWYLPTSVWFDGSI